jgi:predicted aspartyl protease
MPVFNFFHWSEKHGRTLNETGALVSVEIGIPSALKQYLSEKGLAIPAAVSGFALVDTGAFATAVDESVFDSLGVPHIDEIPTDTAHGPGKSKVYPANINFPGMNVTDMTMERVIGSKLKWKTKDEKEIIMLMGRDLLKYFLFVYNGLSSDVTLCY